MKKTAQEMIEKDYFEAVEVMEDRAVEVDQNWEEETTTYIFEDGSKIIDCCGELTAE